MGLGNTPQATYLSITNEQGGKLRHKSGDSEILYDYLEGSLREIELRKESYQGDEYFKYYFWFDDPHSEQVFALQSSEGSTFSRSLINSLANLENPTIPLRVVAYNKDIAERQIPVPFVARASNLDESVSWAVPPEKIPDTERVTVGQKEVIDDSARRKFFRKIVAKINQRAEDASFSPDIPSEDNSSGPQPDQQPQSPTDAYAETQTSGLGDGLPEDFEDLDDDLPF